MENKTEGKKLKDLIGAGLVRGLHYGEYRSLMDQLAREGKTTGLEQSKLYSDFTKLNQQRMKRLDKTVKLEEEVRRKVAEIPNKMTWLVLTESWCGDAAQTIPVINQLALLNPNITLKLILRDENLELMEHFLSNGTRSIPKLLALDAISSEVLWTWGPRPSEARKMANDYQKMHGQLTPEFKEDLQVWYNRNKGKNTVEDLMELLFLE
ncbi:thioredoxin family protein [Sediminicola sp. 1XM1-17]|uniref:thioredoxin family protein n=1 Tax=Sediminicola sp. 1XM1-17 TaxID=3127702 RepID=UPI00307843E4